jgi:hypothetical protein
MHPSASSAFVSASSAAAPRRTTAVFVLYLLDAFVIGGCVAILAVRHLVLSIFDSINAASAAGLVDSSRAMIAGGEYLSLLDHLLPYYLVCGSALLVLGLLTLGVWLSRAQRTMRKP